MDFYDLDLSDNVLDALDAMNFTTCTPVQEKCIPEILNRRDVLGVAQTGTGKTAAYLLPILSMLDDGGYYEPTADGDEHFVEFPHDAINCVIMSPTRELAQQIDQAMQGFAYYTPQVGSVAVYGGNDGSRYDQEYKSMRLGADMIIATPGRLISHITLGNVDLSHVSFFVLDEADRMLDMGFSEDILSIAKLLPANCQTIMYSATMPDKIEQMAKTLLKNPAVVKIAVSRPAEKIKQSAYVCHEDQKLRILNHLFRNNELRRVIIFASKKTGVKEINRNLRHMGINCAEMHSDLSQAERDDVMYRFKSGQVDVLVATDIVARGIDIDDIATVINYDVPHDSEDYVHRIGRTARAERDGRAITLVRGYDIGYFQTIEKFLGYAVEKNPLPDGMEGPEYKPIKGRPGQHPKGRYNRKGHGRHDKRKGSHRGGKSGGGKKTTGGKPTEAKANTSQSKAVSTKPKTNNRNKHPRTSNK